jgi:SAM-dependent methyltransferase
MNSSLISDLHASFDATGQADSAGTATHPHTDASANLPGKTALRYADALRPYLKSGTNLSGGVIPEARIRYYTEGMRANAHYFSHPKWMDDWLVAVHRYPELRERWHAAIGSLDGKVLVDLGCGPGNLLATLGGKPKVAIGVDIAMGSLERAAGVGYVPLRADAQSTPLASGIADIVAINGSLHHFDDMRRGLVEAARLVRPGGMLVLDHDPQQSAWHFRGLALMLWRLRLPLYRWLQRGGHTAGDNEQQWALATELHHRPGDGVTKDLLRSTLEPLRFDVDLYPHSHFVGREVLTGKMGRQPLKIRFAQRLSGIDPNSPEAALSLLCVATRRTA